jgi:hypothetical protein
MTGREPRASLAGHRASFTPPEPDVRCLRLSPLLPSEEQRRKPVFNRPFGIVVISGLVVGKGLVAQNSPPKDWRAGVWHSVTETASSPLPGNLTYYPIAPCRIFDSRQGSGLPGADTGPLAKNENVAIQATDAGTHLACGIPYPSAKAVMLNFIAVAPEGAGDLRAWAWDSVNTTAPNSSVVNFAVVNGLNIANGVIVPICDVNVATSNACNFDAFLRPDVSRSQVVIDALGYFAPVNPLAFQCQIADTVQAVSAGSSLHFNSPTCPSGYTATGGGFFSDAFPAVVGNETTGVSSATPPFAANLWQCGVTNTGAVSANVTCRAICCQTAPTAENAH